MDTLLVLNTSIQIFPYAAGENPELDQFILNTYTAIDRYSQTEYPCGYLILENKLYLPRGTSIPKLELLTGLTAEYHEWNDPSEKMQREHSSLYEPRDALQEESVNFLIKNKGHQLALNTLMGFGKAEPISRRIPTPDGWKRMGDIQPGDKVLGVDGLPIKVMAVHPQGSMDIYKVRFSDGRYSLCTLNHLWSVRTEDSATYRIKSLEEIILNFSSHVYSIPLMTGVAYYNRKEVSENPYQVGQSGKDIPDDYFYNDALTRLKLLWGLMDRYAVYCDDIYIYKNTDLKLLRKVQDLLHGLGFTARRKKNSLEIENWNPFLLKTEFGFTVKPRELIMEDIRLVKQEEAKCLTVGPLTSLYLTEDFIVTHNSYCVAYVVSQLQERSLIITHNESIKNQWIKQTFTGMFDYKKTELMNISGSQIMELIMDDLFEAAEVYFVNHQTLRSYLSTHGYLKLGEFFRKLKVGVKVYDEAHLEFANILLMDMFSNTKQTFYLTATFDRSDKTESECFKKAFKSVLAFGEKESLEVVQKHIIYHAVYIRSRPNTLQMRKIIPWAGYTATTYSRWAFQVDPNQTAYQTIKSILSKVKELEGKVLIFVSLTEVVDKLAGQLKIDYPEKSVGSFHSKVDKEEKESAIKKDIIVSTIKSTGTGRDIPGLRVIICCDPIASSVQTKQLLGRLRPYGQESTYFFDVVDSSIPHQTYWHNSRMKTVRTLVKSIVNLEMD